MRTLQHASILGLLIAVACLASRSAWSEDEAEQVFEADVESVAERAVAEETPLEENAGVEPAPLIEEAPLAEDSPTSVAAPLDEERFRQVDQATRAARGPEPAPAGGLAQASVSPPAPPVAPENPVEFRRRVQHARQLAAKQRKARGVELVPEGLSREELEIRAAERNVAIYDKQMETAEGTPAIEAYRRYALQTLADLRRRYLAKVWADTLQNPEAPRILRQHAQRMAELRRIRLLADVRNYSGLVRQTDELISREAARFERSMQALRGGVTAANAGAVRATAPPAVPH